MNIQDDAHKTATHQNESFVLKSKPQINIIDEDLIHPV